MHDGRGEDGVRDDRGRHVVAIDVGGHEGRLAVPSKENNNLAKRSPFSGGCTPGDRMGAGLFGRPPFYTIFENPF